MGNLLLKVMVVNLEFIEKFRKRIQEARETQNISSERLFVICEDLLVALEDAHRTINLQVGHLADADVSIDVLRRRATRLEVALAERTGQLDKPFKFE